MDEIRRATMSLYGPAFYLEQVLPVHARRSIKGVLTVIIVALLVLYALGRGAAAAGDQFADFATLIAAFGPQIMGLLAMALAARLFVMALDLFSHSFLFQDLDSTLEQPSAIPVITVEAAHAIIGSTGGDPVSGLLNSEVGLESLFRVGIPPEVAREFEKKPASRAEQAAVTFPLEQPLSLSRFAEIAYDNDKAFSNFLFSHGVQKDEFLGAIDWVEGMRRDERKKARWWSKDELGRIPGIGKDWAYGEIYALEKYASDMIYHPVYRSMTAASSIGQKEVQQLETILARAREANALLVGEAGSGVLEVIARFTREIQEGHILPSLESKRVFLVDGESLVAVAREKGAFEQEFMNVMNQSVKAGNIILVFENLPAFIKSAEAMGVNIIELLEPYLTSSSIQIIATADPGAFHTVLERNGVVMQAFEVVHLQEVGEVALLDAIKLHARQLERGSGVFFTYQAVKEVIDAADQFIPYGVMPDKAIDLLTEIVPTVVTRKQVLIEKKDVQGFISNKTGIPVGDVGGSERDELINLEQTLASRVIGQPEATKQVASAMRRARAGTRSTKRPMGTFLFLGPTGVGKTETAKALAELFFKKSDAMIRLQMPEYNGPDALDRLIGSFESGKPGVLSNALKERPYGVLLLDEFEKTTKDVLNLFLQIFDEGQFTDAAGKRVDARNVIMIATSNAGADIIWEYFKKKEAPSAHRDEMIDEIIKRGIFKPELVNRFDGVVVFNPLSEEVVRKIAALQLDALATRLRERGVDFVVNDAAINAVVAKGYEPEFGARAMNRAISEKVEQVIADRMIQGSVKPGMKVELQESDFAAGA